MLCPLYMAEISPPEFRGALMAMEQFSIVLGCVLGFWAGFFTRGGMSSPSPDNVTAGLDVFDVLNPPTQYKTNARFPMATLHYDKLLCSIVCSIPTVSLCSFWFSTTPFCACFWIPDSPFSYGQSKDPHRGGFRSGFN